MKTPTIFACVWTGTLYPLDYVLRMERMIRRHLPGASFVCLTDRPKDLEPYYSIIAVDVSKYGLPGWWAKMALFEPRWRDGYRVVYLDLDMVVTGSLEQLVLSTEETRAPLTTCRNFTRAAGNADWPCLYGSCAIVVQAFTVQDLWARFWWDRELLMRGAGRLGDQKVIEWLHPTASFFQDHLPKQYFLGYRDLPEHLNRKPANTSVVVFAGKSKPHSCDIKWVREAWEA